MDATQKLLSRFDDREDWDSVVDNVPIFIEHECYGVDYEVDDGKGGKKTQERKVIVLPGEEPPKGGKLLYTVDAKALKKTAASVNKNFRDYGKPIKVFVGHTKDPAKHGQEEQPPLVGYGVSATVAPWGPKRIAAVQVTQYVEKGCLDEVRKYPERSPEFYPGKGEITALALLKSDPRLPMGMMAYTLPDGVVQYGRGFESAEEPEKKPAEKGKGKSDDDSDLDDKPPTDEKTPPEPEGDKDEPEGDPDDMGGELSPDEAKQALRMAGHFEKHHPAFKYMCQQYAASCAGPTNGTIPAAAGKKSEERTDMARTEEEQVQYAALASEVAELKAKNSRLESERIVERLIREGVKIARREDEILKFSRLDDAGKKDREDEIRVNYAREDRPPVGDGWLPTYDGGTEGGGDDPQFDSEDIDEAVAYAKSEHIDPEDQRGWDNAMQRFLAEKKKKVGAK